MKKDAIYLVDLQRARLDAGLLQSDLEEAIPASQTFISKVENCVMSPSFRFTLKCVERIGRPLTAKMGDQLFSIALLSESDLNPPNEAGNQPPATDDLPELDQVGLVGRSLHATQQAKEYVDLWN